MVQVEIMLQSTSTPGFSPHGIAQPADLSYQHLQAELLRIDLLIRQQVLRWQRAGQDPRDAFRGLYISDSEVALLMEHPLGANWGQYGVLTDEEEAWFESGLGKASEQVSVLEAKVCDREELRLVRLSERFGWEPFDRDAFLICAASFLDLKYERLYGYLQDDVTRKKPTVNLILDLLCPTGPNRFEKLAHFDEDAPLFKQHFIEKAQDQPGKLPLLSQSLLVDEGIVRWLLGKYQPRPEMAKFLHLSEFEPDSRNGADGYIGADGFTGTSDEDSKFLLKNLQMSTSGQMGTSGQMSKKAASREGMGAGKQRNGSKASQASQASQAHRRRGRWLHRVSFGFAQDKHQSNKRILWIAGGVALAILVIIGLAAAMNIFDFIREARQIPVGWIP